MQIQNFITNYMQEKPASQQLEQFFSISHQQNEKKEDTSHCTVQSEYADSYKEAMKHFASLVEQQNNKNAAEKLKQHEIFFKTGQQAKKQMELSIKRTSINRQIIVLIAKFGQFEMEIKVLNIQGENSKHKNSKSKGEHGHIYQGQFLNKQFAMKCIPIKSKSTRRNAIAEWFIAKIASVFEFGPNIQNILGFDILMYQTCIEFPMQNCKAVDYSCVNVNTLFWNLALMHSLHLVHCDIKPQNIMLSPQYKKIVFIDFGLSTFVSQNIGFKSFTLFVGGVQFCSLQMSKCVLNTSPVPVDLYYNDLCCLKGIFKMLANINLASFCLWKQYQPQLNMSIQWAYLFLYQLKFYLYEKQLESFFVLWNSGSQLNNFQRYKTDILLFLEELYPTQQLKIFFWKFITDSQVDSDHCSRIKLIYEISQENLCSISMLINEEKRSYYTSLVEEFMTEQETHEKAEQNRKKAIAHLVVNSSAIRGLSYLNYVDIYLQYMSYMDNKFLVDTAKREEAAKVYYSIFISSKAQQNVSGRKIIQLTIRHILQKMLIIIDLKENSSLFAIFSFRLFSFIVILDIGSPQQIINWMDKILLSWCLVLNKTSQLWCN